MKRTKLTTNLAAFTACGWKQTVSRSAKYLILQHPDETFFILLGKSGAVRKNTKPVAANSWSITDRAFHRATLAKAETVRSAAEIPSFIF